MKAFKTFVALVAMALTAVSANAQFTTGGGGSNSGSSSFSNELTGYRGWIDAGYSFGIGDWAAGRAELVTVHGYQFNPYIFAGIGTGVHFYCTDGMDTTTIPVFADFRAQYSTGKIVPFFDFRIGYSIELDYLGGLYFSPSVGVRVNKCSLSVGYSGQKWDTGIGITPTLGALTLRVGYEF